MRIVSIAIAALLLGCDHEAEPVPESELPPLDFHGERVRVGSDVADQVCEGTLARLDREVELIESRLDLPVRPAPLHMYVLSEYAYESVCPLQSGGCAPRVGGEPSAAVRQFNFDRSIAHELVHARLSPLRSVPLFQEGLAEAASVPTCPRPVPSVRVSTLLGPFGSVEFSAIDGSYYVAGELVAWLLGEFGPDATLNFMHSVGKGSSPAIVQAAYADHFGRDLEDDYLDHLRTQADLDALPPEHFGCFTDTANPADGPVHLAAALDCDSERVHNDFQRRREGIGYVEWGIELTEPHRLAIAGEVPLGSSLSIEECGCIHKFGDEYNIVHPVGTHEVFSPGIYRLRWTGELDVDLSLDVQLVSQ
jgi:hypothetical protein